MLVVVDLETEIEVSRLMQPRSLSSEVVLGVGH